MSAANSRTKNSFLNILTGFSGQIITTILSFACRTIFIRTLGASYLGINGLFSDILSLLSLGELGFDTAISFRLYKPIAESNDKKVREYLTLFKTIYRIIGIGTFGVGLFLIPLLPYLIKDYDTFASLGIRASFIFVLYLFQNVSTYLFFAYRSIVVKADQKQHILDIVGFGTTILSNVAKIIVLVTLSNFTAYIVVTTSFLIIQNLINALVATKRYPRFFIKEKSALSKAEKIDLYKDCGALFVYKINNVVIKATDNIVLSKFIGLMVVGLYSNYLIIYSTIYNILHIMFRSVKASMGNLFITENVERSYLFFEIMNYVAIILYGTAAVGVAIVANELITCWIGTDYVIAQPLSILIGIELLFAGLKLNLAQIRNVTGIFKQMWFRPVIGSIINVVSSIVLVQFWGISGVIIGTILAAVFANFMVDPRAIHKYSFHNYKPSSYYYRKNIGFILVLFMIGAVDFYICSSIFLGHGIWSVMVHALIIGVSVPAVFIGLHWKKPECIYLRQKFVSVCRRVRNHV